SPHVFVVTGRCSQPEPSALQRSMVHGSPSPQSASSLQALHSSLATTWPAERQSPWVVNSFSSPVWQQTVSQRPPDRSASAQVSAATGVYGPVAQQAGHWL